MYYDRYQKAVPKDALQRVLDTLAVKAQKEGEEITPAYRCAYQEGKNVTARRMYLETMENILSKSDKIIVDQGKNGHNVVPYLPLDKLK